MEKEDSKDWLKKEFGVDLSELDEDARELVSDIGHDGVKSLVERARERELYRGERITKKETTRLLQNVARLAEEGGGEWAEGESSIKGDKPNDWIFDELKQLSDMEEERV